MWLRFRGFAAGAARTGGAPGRLSVEATALDRLALDEEVDELAARGGFRVEVNGGDGGAAGEVGRELAARCRRWRFHRNTASREPAFADLLLLHRALHHDLAGADGERLALARADYRHALDVWQWVLALDREAGAAVQLAALLHDVERVVAPEDRRRAEAAADYGQAKARHARASAAAAAGILADSPVDPATAERAVGLIAAHDRPAPPGDPESDLALLEDADALSFLVLNSHGYRRYHGEETWREKLRWTLGRLGPRGRSRLAAVRLAPELAALLPHLLPALLAAPAVAPTLLSRIPGEPRLFGDRITKSPREET